MKTLVKDLQLDSAQILQYTVTQGQSILESAECHGARIENSYLILLHLALLEFSIHHAVEIHCKMTKLILEFSGGPFLPLRWTLTLVQVVLWIIRTPNNDIIFQNARPACVVFLSEQT